MALRSPKHGLTHGSRGWVKRINGKPRWICSDRIAPTPEAADDYYEKHFTDIWQPPTAPPATVDEVTVGYLGDAWHDRKSRSDVEAETVAVHDAAVADFVMELGRAKLVADLAPADFRRVRAGWAKRFGPHRLRQFIGCIKAMFRWAHKPPLRLPEPDYGDEFNEPRRIEVRRHEKKMRDTHGARIFTADDVAKLVKAANVNFRAMILLALNGGLGSTDLADMPLTVLKLDAGFLDYARRKTGVDRRIPLWPETVEALRAVMADRAKLLETLKVRGRTIDPKATGLVFVTMFGRPYLVRRGGKKSNQIVTVFNELCARTDLKRHFRGLYSLRRTFRTVADELGDARAADKIMGHSGSRDMGGVYVVHLDDARLSKLTEHVRSRLKIPEAWSGRDEKTAPLATSTPRPSDAPPGPASPG